MIVETSTQAKLHQLAFRAMGCQMTAMVDADPGQPPTLLDRVPQWFEDWEQTLSRFRPDSELNLINRASGRPVSVSPVMWEVLKAALIAERETNGLVTPTVLDALVAAGYDRSFDDLPGDIPHPTLPTLPISTQTLASIAWDADTHTIWFPPEMHLDLGGIAKGWAAQQAVERLKHLGPALLNAGGDIAISAPRRDGSAWPIGVEDPHNAGAMLEVLKVSAGGVATSGRDYRRWQQAGKPKHHIIDPRSGQPAATDLMTVTVIAPSAVEAEAAAKAVFILGSREGATWLTSRPWLAGLLVFENGQRFYTPNMRQFLW